MNSRHGYQLLALLAVGVLGASTLAACGGDDSSSNAAPTDGSTTTLAPTSSSGGAATSFTVAVKTTALGDTLVSTDGKTLYAFKNDKGGKSTCNAGCDATWPALTTTGAVTLATGLDAEDFKTIMRDDGKTQVTDYGQPLYTYAGDTKAGDTNGDGIGGVWYAVGKDGKAVSSANSSTATSSTEAPTTTTSRYGY